MSSGKSFMYKAADGSQAPSRRKRWKEIWFFIATNSRRNHNFFCVSKHL